MNKAAAMITGVGLGMALMYVFDPDRGRRRRALMKDKAVGMAHDVSDAVGSRGRDLSNRAQGLMHEVKDLLPHTDPNARSDDRKQPSTGTPTTP